MKQWDLGGTIVARQVSNLYIKSRLHKSTTLTMWTTIESKQVFDNNMIHVKDPNVVFVGIMTKLDFYGDSYVLVCCSNVNVGWIYENCLEELRV